MSVVVTKEIKKKRKLLAIFAVSMLTTAVVLYFGMFRDSAPSAPDEPAADGVSLPPADLESEVPRLEVRILDDERFKNLQPSPGLPVATTTAGKANPFSD